MNIEQEQEFFSQIEKVFHAHEDVYDPNAWEEFEIYRNSKKSKLPIYTWIAAAVILMIVSFGLYQFIQKENFQNPPVLVQKTRKYNNFDKEENHSKFNNAEQLQTNELIVKSNKRLLTNKLVPKINNYNSNFQSNNLNTQVIVGVNSDKNQEIINKDEIINLKEEKKILNNKLKSLPIYAGAYDSLLNINTQTLEKHVNKLTYSVVVSPSFSNEKINFGAGLEISYAINKKFSINSGLIYSSFNAVSDGKSFKNTSISPSKSADLAITGIELPLAIQYQTKSGFYASAGVSGVGLVNDKLEYNYLEEKMVSVTEFSVSGNIEVFKLISEQKIEKSIAPLNNYMGFFNFSAGKKQAIGKMNINIGPFVKIPFSSVSVEKIKLTQGGLKLSVDF